MSHAYLYLCPFLGSCKDTCGWSLIRRTNTTMHICMDTHIHIHIHIHTSIYIHMHNRSICALMSTPHSACPHIYRQRVILVISALAVCLCMCVCMSVHVCMCVCVLRVYRCTVCSSSSASPAMPTATAAHESESHMRRRLDITQHQTHTACNSMRMHRDIYMHESRSAGREPCLLHVLGMCMCMCLLRMLVQHGTACDIQIHSDA